MGNAPRRVIVILVYGFSYARANPTHFYFPGTGRECIGRAPVIRAHEGCSVHRARGIL